MPVSDDEIIWAYRMLLGREPESADAIATHRETQDRDTLRRMMMASDEFRAVRGDALPVGRYVVERASDIEVACTPDELRRMLARISREWIGFGERDAHWSVLTQEEFRTRNIGANEDVFYQTGRQDIAQVTSMVRRSRPDARFGRALDFGCGVGRLTLALAHEADEVLGIDISPPHLALARARAEKTGQTNARFAAISAVEDLSGHAGFDLVVSLIVLQHNPPPVMAELLGRLLGALAPGGVAVFQIPTYLHGWSFSVAEYLANAQPQMEMNALPQHVVFDIVEQAGCAPLEVREDGRMGPLPGLSHIFLVERRF